MTRPAQLDSRFVEIEHPFPSGLPVDENGPITEEDKRETSLELRRLGSSPDVAQIRVRRTGYTHHGVTLGDGTVVHFTGEPAHKKDAKVQRTSIDSFLKGGQLIESVLPVQLLLHRSLTALLALLHIDMTGYHLGKRNCEHFATYCQTGAWHSNQIHALTESQDRATNAFEITVDGVLDATFGRLTRWLESHTPSKVAESQTYSRDPVEVEPGAFFYGYLFDGADGSLVLAPVRQMLAEDPTQGGFWGGGLPWNGFSDWTTQAPRPSQVTWVGDIFFDTERVPYLRTSEDHWFRGDVRLGREAIPPLPETHPALVERRYPMEWFE